MNNSVEVALQDSFYHFVEQAIERIRYRTSPADMIISSVINRSQNMYVLGLISVEEKRDITLRINGALLNT